MASAASDTIDYSDPLMDDSLDRESCIADAIRAIHASCPCDLLQFQFIRRSSVLSKVIACYRSCVSTYTTDIPQVIFERGWSDYQHSRSRTERAGFARKRRNLLKIEGIKFEELPHCRITDVITWMIPRKNAWLAQVHKSDETHMSSPNIIRFVTSIFNDLGPQDKCRIYAITRGNEIIAADFCFVGKTAIQWYIGTYNEGYAKYSPGMLLKEFIAEIACSSGLNYDMLRGFGRHKSYFANSTDYATTYRIPKTFNGYLYVFLRVALKRCRLIS
jgi:CelD/BcsL family acetyltransferase involved in cellulose biosynthesis